MQLEEVYQQALKAGSVKTSRGRIVLLGRAGAGKTSVTNALLGKPFHHNHKITNLLDIHHAQHKKGIWKEVSSKFS